MFSDRTISSLLSLGKFSIDPMPDLQSKAIQPASVEFHLAERFIKHKDVGTSDFVVSPGEALAVEPGDCYLACTKEELTLPDNMVARVEGKSTWGRRFLLVHATAGFIDPGFRGTITLELSNIGPRPLLLTPGVPICQVSFDWLDQPAARPYGHPELSSHYQRQIDPTPSHDDW